MKRTLAWLCTLIAMTITTGFAALFPATARGASLWPSTTVPERADSGPDDPVELGVRFRSEVAGTVSAIRFYKSTANTGTHVANLWTADGTLLASATLAGESASGWQEVPLPAPVNIAADTIYVASYHTVSGHYSFSRDFFSGSGVDSPPLHAPAAGGNGLFGYGPGGFPDQSGGANYWVDVVFTPGTQSGVEPAGWYSGDMHVHRSCGNAPESIAGLHQKMAPENLSVISLLADMGNAEVQDALQDLPRVNGNDDPVSTAGRIVHWDTEWHWDPIYWQYPHQALGGHVVALGLNQAQQVWEEYTYPVFNWAHQRGGIAGFAHMQYLDNELPQTLGCCTPIEYPVETALGTSDFISEDVETQPNFATGPDNAIKAYYRLLNCGFRPGLAAGTDYPCDSNGTLGALLTYVKTADGGLSYRAWVEGIARGRTVISRNGHREFLDLKVNGSAAPGDEIRLTGSGSVQVSVAWTAAQQLQGTVELVQNGVVVATLPATAAPGAPVTLTATVNFDRSGWLAARRMSADGHKVHTAAVFVIVNNAPIRTSVADAQFYVQWMDSLLAKTSPGGIWSGYFPTSRAAAQGRYQAARAAYLQIAAEAAATPAATNTIFTTQTPTVFANDAFYELGTGFWSDVNGQITGVRLYAGAEEQGNHLVRIWRAGDGALLAGPYSFSFAAGSAGWKSFTLPSSLAIEAYTDYIVSISTASDNRYSAELHGLDVPARNGHLYTSTHSGVWGDVPGSMPTESGLNANYFRDVVFVPQM